MKELFVAISFFTRIPIKIKSEVTEDEFYSAMRLQPLVGLIIGGLLYLLHSFLLSAADDVRALILVSFYIIITGGLHIDGFMDSIDGLLSNRDKARILEIMKDSRVGSFGVLGMLILFMVYFIFFKYAGGMILVIMPVAGRAGALLSAAITHYAKEKMDLGGRFVEETKLKHAVLAIAFTAVISGLLEVSSLVPLGVAMISAYFITKAVEAKIGGTTGDTTGMIIEVTQAVFLISAYLYGIIAAGGSL